jgi:hypothetical protein
MTDTNYSVITDKEGFDEHQVLTGNKSLTSFTMLSRDSAGTNVMSPASWPYSFVVYASDPVQNIVATKGDTGAAGAAGAAGANGAGGVADFVASGALPDGTPVVLKADGTVEAVVETSTTVTPAIPLSVNAKVMVVNDTSQIKCIAWDPNTAGRFILGFMDLEVGADYVGAVIVGTISGNAITFGTKYVFINAQVTVDQEIAFDPNNSGKFVISFQQTHHKFIVGQIAANNSLSFGAIQTLATNGIDYQKILFDPNTANQFIILYADVPNSHYGTVRVCTISGTVISFGSKTVFASYNCANGQGITAGLLGTSGKFAVGTLDGSSGKIVIGTMSGSSVTFGSSQTVSTTFSHLSIAPQTSAIAISAWDTSNSNIGVCLVGTVSGTVMTFGSPVTYSTGIPYYPSIGASSSDTGTFILTYRDAGETNVAEITVCSFSGTTITIGTSYAGITTGQFNNNKGTPVFDPTNTARFLWGYSDQSNNRPYAFAGIVGSVVSNTNLTATNFIGIPDAAYADTTTATVTLPSGLSTNQTGLTVGATYYVQTDGTLDTTADSPSVIAGKALSATSILLKSY